MDDSAERRIREGRRARSEQRLRDAHRHFAEAVRLARASGDSLGLVAALKGLGQIDRDLGRGHEARPHYEEAVALCRRGSDALLLAHTVRHLGDLHQDSGDLELAEPCYREALELYRNHDATGLLDLANAVRPLALLRERQGRGGEAARLWQEARELYAGLAIEAGVAECDHHLARLE